MIREIVNIDESKCDGCGVCIPNCHEGALQMIDGKARLISDLLCDGLGACIGHCPQDAITIEKREAAAYDEVEVMKDMVSKGKNTVIAHLKHLKDHNEKEFLQQGVNFLLENRSKLEFTPEEVITEITNQMKAEKAQHEHKSDGGCGGGCPGSATQDFREMKPAFGAEEENTGADTPSALRQWPVQMHLVNPMASYFRDSDLLMAADCVAFSLGNFHSKFLKGKSLAIACPKLDSNQQIYIDKLVSMIDEAKINTITVMVMEVPCCGGLLQIVKNARQQAQRNIPIKQLVVGIQGDILEEEWI